MRPAPAGLVRRFDDVIVATGVRPRPVDLPGFAPRLEPPERGPHVVTYADLLEGRVEAGERVAVIGAGGIGVDVAEFLTAPRPSLTLDRDAWLARWGVGDPAEHRGGLAPAAPTPPAEREVHLLQRKPTKIGAGLGRTTGWVHRAELRHAGVVHHVGVAYERIDEAGLHLVEDGEEKVLDVDTVVLCAGQESADDLSPALLAARSGTTPRVRVVGGADVAAELDAERAIRQAVEAAAAL